MIFLRKLKVEIKIKIYSNVFSSNDYGYSIYNEMKYEIDLHGFTHDEAAKEE